MTDSINNTDDELCGGEYSKERLIEAEKVMGRLIVLCAQANHFGKNSACPQCQCVVEMTNYLKKWGELEKIVKENSEEMKEFMKNPKKHLFS